MTFDFLAHDTDSVLWHFDYASKSFIHTETGAKFPFRFDPDNGIFTTSKGVDLKVIPMSKFTLADFQNNYRKLHEPMPPKHKVKTGEGEKDFILETNENDKGWQLEYARFTENASLALLHFLISYSVECKIPPDSEGRMARMARAMGVNTENGTWEDERVYYYVKEALGADEQEMYAFFDVLMGRNLITKGALDKSQQRFPDDSSGA